MGFNNTLPRHVSWKFKETNFMLLYMLVYFSMDLVQARNFNIEQN